MGEGEGLRERSIDARGVLIGFGAIVASVLVAVLAARALLWAAGGVPASDGASAAGLSAADASAAGRSSTGASSTVPSSTRPSSTRPSSTAPSATGGAASAGVSTRVPGGPFTRASGPPLEVTPRQALQRYRAEQRRKLEGYHLVDEKAGIVQIPIERAMALLAEEHAAEAASKRGPQ